MSEISEQQRRHSAAHMMARAVMNLFDDVQVDIGPATDDGFYYDFDLPHRITPEDFPKIEAEIDAELEIKLYAIKVQKGKLPPEQALVGIKKGMAAKFCTQICLVKQDYVADGEVTVEKYLEGVSKEVGAPITVKRFCRMQLGA